MKCFIVDCHFLHQFCFECIQHDCCMFRFVFLCCLQTCFTWSISCHVCITLTRVHFTFHSIVWLLHLNMVVWSSEKEADSMLWYTNFSWRCPVICVQPIHYSMILCPYCCVWEVSCTEDGSQHTMLRYRGLPQGQPPGTHHMTLGHTWHCEKITMCTCVCNADML